MFDGWRIARFSPQGEELESHLMPGTLPDDGLLLAGRMQTLYITTTRKTWRTMSWRYPLSAPAFTSAGGGGRDEEITVPRTLT